MRQCIATIIILILALVVIHVSDRAITVTAGVVGTVEEKLNKSGPETNVTNPLGMSFVFIPAGSFIMGSDLLESTQMLPHLVNIKKSFYLQSTEVTQGQWQKVVGNNPAFFKNGDDFPVERVSWDDTQEFIRKLNELDKGKGYRLPTEAEWEYACRAGGKSDRYGELDSIAWYNKNSGGQTHPVGIKLPNPWGLYDMLGNVSEWCADWYGEYYSIDAVTDPTGPSSGSYRVYRGGSWIHRDKFISSFSRFRHIPGFRLQNLGFRIARNITESDFNTK